MSKRNAYPFSCCMTSITCLIGSVLILLAPVKGWSRTKIKNKICDIVIVSVAVIKYCALMFFIPNK